MDRDQRHYILGNALHIAKLARLLAKLIDLVIIALIIVALYPIGVVIAVAYLSLSDSLQDGRSIGKRFIGLKVVSLIDGKPCNFRQSLIRNLPLIIPTAMLILPVVGWLLALLVGIPLIALEIYLLMVMASGHRLGDIMADTTVMAHDMEKLKRNRLLMPSFLRD